MRAHRLLPLVLAAACVAGCSLLFDVDSLVDAPVDAGWIVDAGDPLPDAGESPADSGDVIQDAGEEPPDAGDVIQDAGEEPPDAGDVIQDAGGEPPDAGTPPIEEQCVASGWCRQFPDLRDRFNNPVTIGALYAVTGTGADTVWAAGQNAQVLHWDGVRWSEEARSFGFVYALWIDPSGHGLAVGHDGAGAPLVRRRSPAGTWTTESNPLGATLGELRSVWGRVVSGQVEAWAVGGTREVFKLAGGVWSRFNLPVGYTAAAVWGLPVTGGVRVVYASYDAVLSLEPDGTENEEASTYGPTSMWGAPDGQLWGVAGLNLFERQASLWRWVVHTVPGSGNRSTRAVCGRSGGPLLVVSQDLPTGASGSTGAMRRFEPGLDAFVTMGIPSTEFIESCWMAPGGEAWAVGSEGLQPPTGILLHHPDATE